MIKELSKDMAKYSLSLIIPVIIEIIALPIITRMFSPAEYGNYILAKSLIGILTIISTSWFVASFARFFPQFESKGQQDIFISSVLRLAVISIGSTFLLSSILLLLLRSQIPQALNLLVWIGLPLFVTTAFFDIFIKILRARRYAREYSVYVILNSIMGFGIGIILVKMFKLDIRGLLFGLIISSSILSFFLAKVAIKKISLTSIIAFKSIVLEIAKFGVPASMIYLLTWILDLSDKYIIAFFHGSLEVGIYSANYSVASRSMFSIVSLFLLAGHPIVYEIFEKNGLEETKKFMPKLTRLYFLAGVPAVIGLIALTQPIVSILTAPGYHQGSRVISWVASGFFLMGIANIVSLNLGIYKKMNVLMLCYLSGAICNIILNLLFVPRFGYIAAAITTFASYAITAVLTCAGGFSCFRWNFPLKSGVKILFSSAIMGAAVFLVGNKLNLSNGLSISLSFVFGILIYTAALLGVKEIDMDEIKKAVSLFKSCLA